MKKKLSPAKPREPESLEGDIASRIVDVEELTEYVTMVLYGRSGTGKTTFAGSFPMPGLLIDCNDRGTRSVRGVAGLKVLPARTLDDVKQAYWLLESGKHKFKTVIIDTVSMLQDFAIRHVLSESKRNVEDGDLGGWGTMRKQDWGDVSTIMKAQLMNFRELPMNVVFIAQDRTSREDGNDEDGGISPEVGPRVMPSVASVMNAAVDWIGNTFVKEKVITIKTGVKKKERREIQYCIRIGPHSSYITKVRKPKEVEVPRFIADPSYDKLMELVKGE